MCVLEVRQSQIWNGSILVSLSKMESSILFCIEVNLPTSGSQAAEPASESRNLYAPSIFMLPVCRVFENDRFRIYLNVTFHTTSQMFTKKPDSPPRPTGKEDLHYENYPSTLACRMANLWECNEQWIFNPSGDSGKWTNWVITNRADAMIGC